MNILTFDIEDWYNHDDYTQDFAWDKFEVRLYEGVDKILAALDERKIEGTFLCLGWIAEKHPGIIRAISDAGHHIGCHSYQHQLATRFSPEAFRADTYRAKCLLEEAAGQRVDTFRVPSFSITHSNKWAFDTLAELGFAYDCSVFPSRHEFGGIPGFPAEPAVIETPHVALIEFPVNLGRVCGREIVYAGGGYFRVMPYALLREMARKAPYLMAYFHPSDFDPGQPRMPQLPALRQFKNRVALKGAYGKFRRFIADFDFMNIPAADRAVDWTRCRHIDLSDL